MIPSAAPLRRFWVAGATSLLLLIALNGVMAQEITPEPPPPTEIPTATPTETPTATPTETPTPTEAIPTETATALPTMAVSPEVTLEVTPEITSAALTPEVTSEIVPVTDIPFGQLPGDDDADGTISVIVQLNTNAAIGNITRGDMRAVAAAEMQVQMAQDAVAQGLLQFDAQVVRDYDLLPALALEVDAAGLAYLQSSPLVMAIQPNERNYVDLASSTQVIGASTAGTGAWAQGYTGAGYTVAIVDIGTAANHPFLGGRVVAEACFSGGGIGSESNCPNGLATQTGPGAASPSGCLARYNNSVCDHGTHVAGIAAGADPNGVGTAPDYSGVAPGVNIIAVDVFSHIVGCTSSANCHTAYDADILAGMDYVYQLSLTGTYNIAALNLSLGKGLYSSVCDTATGLPPYFNEVNLLRARGIITVVATGNFGASGAMTAPGCLSNVVSVGSMKDNNTLTTADDSIASSSDRASFMTLLAPGDLIDSSIYNNGAMGYGSKSGTSMATPMVTGALAVLRQRAPEAPIDALVTALRSTGTPMVDTATGITYRRLNLDLALRYGLFDLTAPNLTANPSGLMPTFNWTPASDAQYYNLVVANSVGASVFDQWFTVGTSPLNCTTSLCSVRLTTPLPSTIGTNSYSWYVRAYSTAGTNYGYGAWMGPLAFNVLPLTQTSPNGIVNDGDGRPNFTWMQLTGATHYQLYIAPVGSPGTTVDEWMTSAVCSGGTCTYEPTTALQYNGVYNWYVRAYGPDGYVPWTNGLGFTLAATAPVNPTQVTPTNGANLNTNTVQFEWTTMPGATYYELYVGTATTMLHQKWYALSELTPSGGNYQVTVPITGTGPLVWYVRSYGPGGYGTGGTNGWSGPINFTITSVSAPTVLDDNQEAAASNRGDLTYTWDHNTRNEWYELYIANTAGTVLHQQWYQVSALGCAANCSVHPGVSLINGNYVWYVRGWSSTAGYTTGGYLNTGWGGTGNITISQSAADAGLFDVLGAFTVEGGAVPIMTDSPTFTWNDIADAMWYELYVVNQLGAVVHDVWYSRLPDNCDGSFCIMKPANLYLTNGTYTWYVRAWGPAGYATGGPYGSGWSGPNTFQIAMYDSMNTTTPTLGMVINTTTSKPNFQWPVVDGATWYQLAIVNNTSQTTVFQQWIHFNAAGITCTTTCEWAQPIELANGPYTWHVQAYGPGGTSQWSDPGNFSVAVPPPDAATLNTPTNGTIALTNSVTFTWTPANNATYYNLQVQQGTTMVVNTWYSSAQVSCGGTCTMSATLGWGDYQWQVFTYGPGTVGAAYTPSATRNLTVLE